MVLFPRSTLRRSPTCALFLVGALLVSCDDQTLELGPDTAVPPNNNPDMAMAGGQGGGGGEPMGGAGGVGGEGGTPMGGAGGLPIGGEGGQMGGGGGEPMGGVPGGAGGGEPPPDPCESPMPLVERFADEVIPALTIGCGGRGCHGAARGPGVDPGDNSFRFWESNNPLNEEQVQATLDETLRLVNFCSAEDSALLLYARSNQDSTPIHPTATPPMPAGTAPYNTIVSWIEDSVPVPDMYVPPPPEDAGVLDAGVPDAGEDPPDYEPAPVPCDGIPAAELFDRFDLDQFRGLVNPMIIRTCANGAGCHMNPGEGGGLYYLTNAQDDCSQRWNLLVTQWYINPVDLPRSLILTKPLDRNHGGRVVFDGTDDRNYILLSTWLLEAFE